MSDSRYLTWLDGNGTALVKKPYLKLCSLVAKGGVGSWITMCKSARINKDARFFPFGMLGKKYQLLPLVVALTVETLPLGILAFYS